MVQYLQILLNARLAKMEERGATAVEYGLLVALIAVAIIIAVRTLGDNLTGVFDNVGDEVGGAGGDGGAGGE
ncbi:pilus assembly protein Flp/PilA [Nocardioides sp. J9]|uniref:Flp family type IVb pilin n=1 Tax=unclassified Nocardioides TaxID=2615069 RepID=UPI00049028B1|nr:MULTISPECIES: Flp family type IVb pilin [unclassified Nocardioides]TWH01372.1 pilus assembly protein Flp/PilA [Nocardioides sp. J9]